MINIDRVIRIVMIGCVLLLGCMSAAAQDIRYNAMPGTDFSKYRTYKWVRVQGADYPNEILDAQITQAIDAQLALKGLSRTESNTSDLVVTYQAAVSQEKRWNSYSTGGDMWGWGGWRGWGGYYGGMGGTTTTTSQTIHTGTINVDLYDVAQRKQVWRGAASKTLGSGKDSQKVQKNLNKAMAKLFKKYPPPVKR